MADLGPTTKSPRVFNPHPCLPANTWLIFNPHPCLTRKPVAHVKPRPPPVPYRKPVAPEQPPPVPPHPRPQSQYSPPPFVKPQKIETLHQPRPSYTQRPPMWLQGSLGQSQPRSATPRFGLHPGPSSGKLLERIDQQIKLATRAYVRELLTTPMDDLD